MSKRNKPSILSSRQHDNLQVEQLTTCSIQKDPHTAHKRCGTALDCRVQGRMRQHAGDPLHFLYRTRLSSGRVTLRTVCPLKEEFLPPGGVRCRSCGCRHCVGEDRYRFHGVMVHSKAVRRISYVRRIIAEPVKNFRFQRPNPFANPRIQLCP